PPRSRRSRRGRGRPLRGRRGARGRPRRAVPSRRRSGRPPPRAPAPSLPSRDRDPGPLARLRLDPELVHEPARAAEPEAEAAPGREAVPQRLLDVRDPGAVVLEDEPQPPARAVEGLQPDDAAAAVLHDVAGELARRGHDLRLVDEAEPDADRPLAHGLTDRHHVLPGPDEEYLILHYGHPPRGEPRRSGPCPSRC